MKDFCDNNCFERGFAAALIFIIGAVVAIILVISFELKTPGNASLLKEISNILGGISTVIIAIFAGLQYKIYKFTVNNQSYDKRLRVYEGVRQFLDIIVDKSDLTLADRKIYLDSIKGNNFLFGSDISDYLKDVLRNAAQLRKYVKQNDQDKINDLVDWFINESTNVDKRFDKYLKIYE